MMCFKFIKQVGQLQVRGYSGYLQLEPSDTRPEPGAPIVLGLRALFGGLRDSKAAAVQG